MNPFYNEHTFKKPKEDPKVIEAYDIHFEGIVKKRKLFLKSDVMEKMNIYSFDVILPPEFAFNQIIVNSFLTCCQIELEPNEVVDTGIDRPADKVVFRLMDYIFVYQCKHHFRN